MHLHGRVTTSYSTHVLLFFRPMTLSPALRSTPVPAFRPMNDENPATEPIQPLDYRLWAEAVAVKPTGVVTDDDMRAWIEGPVRRFFPHKRFMTGYAEFTVTGIKVRKRISSGYKPEWLERLAPVFNPMEQNCFSNWIRDREPVLLDPENPPSFASPLEISLAKEFELGLVVYHGVSNFAIGDGSWCVFSGIPPAIAPYARDALNLIAPVTHALLLETLAQPDELLQDSKLSARQLQITDLVAKDFNDREIAAELKISEHTVGNHLRAIYRALHINKRSQLQALLRLRGEA